MIMRIHQQLSSQASDNASAIRVGRSLVARQALLSLLFAVLVGLVMAGIELSTDWQQARAQIRRNTEQHLMLIQASATEAAYQLNHELATNVVRGLLQTDDIHSVRLTDNFGSVLATGSHDLPTGRQPWVGEALVADLRQLRLDLNHQAPHQPRATPVGQLDVELNVARIGERFADQALAKLGNRLGWALVLTGMLAVVFYWTILRPLVSLTHGIGRIDPANPGHSPLVAPPGHADSEFGQLTASINALLTALQEGLHKRERAEAELAHMNRELEKRVDERTQALRDAMHQLEEKTQAAEAGNRAKTTFLATMSHELRTPMNGILGMAQLLEMTELTEEQQEYLTTIRQSGQHLMGMIADLLDLSNLDAQRLRLEQIPYHPQELIEGLCQHYTAASQQRGLTFRYIQQGSYPELVSGDPRRLRQVLTHLLDNACKFTSQGEVVLTVTATQGAGGNCSLNFSIRDSGIGIPADLQAMIARSFVQGDGSSTRQFGGTGLGLALVTRLLDLMGTTLHLESEPGQGSHFWFTLTLPAEPAH